MKDPVVVDGRWTLGALLGRGGSGRVWRARDAISGQEVALKLVRVNSTEHQARVEREILAMRLLRLPGIVQLLDTGFYLGEPYIVMELAPGAHFPGARAVRTWDVLRAPTLRLCEALGRVHAMGIVHRDLKPANVLVDGQDHVTILDFGLAKGTPGEATTTKVGSFVGTPRYLAPEQLAAETVDARADLFALGVMLFEALSGEPPFADADFMSRMVATQECQRLSLDEIAPEVPRGIRNVVHALLSHRPAERPQNALDLYALLAAGGEGWEEERFRLPLMGVAATMAEVIGAVMAGRSMQVGGPGGSGRTRFVRELRARLERVGVQAMITTSGRRPLSALALAFDAATLLAGPEAAEKALRRRLEAGDVLLVDCPDGGRPVDRPHSEPPQGCRHRGLGGRGWGHPDARTIDELGPHGAL